MKQWLGLLGRRPAQAAPTASKPRRHPAPSLDSRTLRTVWQVTSLLLDYPSDELYEALPTIRRACVGLPTELGEPLLRLVRYLDETDLHTVRSTYVDTFDTTRKCALHLTYYSFGDTRKRGIALVQFKQAFRRGGVEVTEDELPDHLSVVLEFGATADLDIAWRLLNDNRAGVELLQLGLDAKRSPWSDAVTALRLTLPTLSGTQLEAVQKLLAEGPPNEDVGLDAYSLDPQLNPHPAADADFEGALR